MKETVLEIIIVINVIIGVAYSLRLMFNPPENDAKARRWLFIVLINFIMFLTIAYLDGKVFKPNPYPLKPHYKNWSIYGKAKQ